MEIDFDIELDETSIASDAAPVVMAFDRANRHIDLDGHMHIETANISKANVCGYYGSEIPDSVKLGLDPSRVYMLYRDPAELEAAAKTFENKPLLARHIAVSADAPQKYYIVGSVSNVRYSHPYLKASLAVWDGEAIREIESHDKEQISCGYRYRADMNAGTSLDGVKYDGRMCDLVANHIALVEIGRAGPDVIVSDELPAGFLMKKSVLLAALAPFMAADADKVALDAALVALAADGKKGKDEAACEPASSEEKPDKAKAQDATAVSETVKGKDAKGAKDSDDMDDMSEDEGPEMSPGPKTKPKEDLKGKGAPSAMDADTVAATIKAAVLANDALHEARREVEAILGSVTFDSASAVYKAALDKLAVDTAGVDPSAYRSLLKIATKPAPAALATDSAGIKSTTEAFGLSRFS